MILTEKELKILHEVVDIYVTKRIGVSNSEVAENIGYDPEYVADIFHMLKDDGYIRVDNHIGGHVVAFPEPRGRLMINDPEYMIRRLTGPKMIQVLIEIVEKSESIPEVNKKSLISRLKNLKDDKYISNIATGVISEVIKKSLGL